MRMFRVAFLFIIITLISNNIGWAQEKENHISHEIKAGIEIPLQYTIQYSLITGDNLSFSSQLGILTYPYNDAILFTLESFGVDEKTIRLIKNAFQIGFLVDMGVNYHFRDNYIGTYGQWINLTAADTPIDLIENYFGIVFPIPEFIPGFIPEISLQSELFQAGLLYGRIFHLKEHPHIEIHAEAAISKNLASKSKLSSENTEVDFINIEIDKALDKTYSRYAYIPSINIYFVYKFGK